MQAFLGKLQLRQLGDVFLGQDAIVFSVGNIEHLGALYCHLHDELFIAIVKPFQEVIHEPSHL